MRVFLAGATGVVGSRLVPMLVAAGHEVVGTTTSSGKLLKLRDLGAEGVAVDLLDRNAVMTAVMRADPDVVIHQATALKEIGALRNPDKEFVLTNRLRTEGTDNLLEAARAAGARRFIAQSYAGWPSGRGGGGLTTEEDPLDSDPVPTMRRSLDAIRHLERVVPAAEGIEGLVLRYGGFYGPGTSISEDGEHVRLIRKRRFPLVGKAAGVWSFTHIDDAAAATLAALDHGSPGIYNVVDDDPAPVSEWLPALAEAVGAKPPRRFPRWLANIAAGKAMVTMVTDVRGASNAKAKRELGWTPLHPSWREGFRHLEDVPVPLPGPRVPSS
jgi:nucleoside-diphosphate-sugar epimerase